MISLKGIRGRGNWSTGTQGGPIPPSGAGRTSSAVGAATGSNWEPAAFLLLCLLPWSPAISQTAVSTDIPVVDTAVYDFVDYSKNYIGRSAALAPFFQRLALLDSGQIQRVSIVHIGDSHIQADFWSGRLRALLQERFGNAGRGLVFPYSLAQTNCPLDLHFSSDAAWQVRKSVFRQEGPPLGICGISIRSVHSAPMLEVGLKDRYHYGRDYRFDRITIFHDDGSRFLPLSAGETVERRPAAYAESLHHRVQAGDTLYDLARRYGCSVADLRTWNRLKGSRIDVGQVLVVNNRATPTPVATTLPEGVQQEYLNTQTTRFTLPENTSALTLGCGEPAKAAGATLFGIILEKSQKPGILYHSIGVNGVTYYHYNRADYFAAQLPALQPDLIIVSLGTNEALASSTEENRFRREVQDLIDRLRKCCPRAAILLTTNPDVLRRKRFDNPRNLTVRRVILETAAQRNLSYWDLHGLMGGAGSVRTWREAGLAHTDFIHFTKEGYWLQAHLLYQALMNAYDARY